MSTWTSSQLTVSTGHGGQSVKALGFPPGRDEERVRDVTNHCEGQTHDQLAAEIQAGFGERL